MCIRDRWPASPAATRSGPLQRRHGQRGDSLSSADESHALIGLRLDAHLVDREAERCLLYTSDAADERSSVDLGGRRIIKKKKTEE